MRQWSIGLSVLAGLVGFGATWIRYHQLSRLTEPVSMDSDLAKEVTIIVSTLIRNFAYSFMLVIWNIFTIDMASTFFWGQSRTVHRGEQFVSTD